MKKNIIYIIMLCIASIITFNSCKADRDIVTLNKGEKISFTINNKQESISINKSNLDKESLSFTWTKTNFGSNIIVKYYLKVSYKEQEVFDVLSDNLQGSINFKRLSEIILKDFKLEGDNEYDLQLAVVARALGSEPITNKDYEIGSNIENIKCSIEGISLIPKGYNLVGDMFERGEKWNIKYRDYQFFLSDMESKTFEYVGKFKANAEFKIVPEEDYKEWDHVIGMIDGQLTWKGGDTNIKLIQEAGYYHISFNSEDLTLAVEKYTGSTTTFEHIGLIGTAGISLEKDIDLTKAPGTEHLWVGKGITLKEGKLKIRANHAWSSNWALVANLPYGTAKAGGDNFDITADLAGNYDVYFNDLTGMYIFKKLK